MHHLTKICGSPIEWEFSILIHDVFVFFIKSPVVRLARGAGRLVRDLYFVLFIDNRFVCKKTKQTRETTFKNNALEKQFRFFEVCGHWHENRHDASCQIGEFAKVDDQASPCRSMSCSGHELRYKCIFAGAAGSGFGCDEPRWVVYYKHMVRRAGSTRNWLACWGYMGCCFDTVTQQRVRKYVLLVSKILIAIAMTSKLNYQTVQLILIGWVERYSSVDTL